MNQSSAVLGPTELALLRGVVGARWLGYGADVMFEGWFAFMDMFVATSTASLTLSVVAEEGDLRGWPEEVTRLDVTSGASGRPEAARKGNLSEHGHGQTVLDVLVIRDTFRGTPKDGPTFEFVTDSGVIVVLEDTCIGICKGGPLTEELLISCADHVGELRLPQGVEQWAPEPGYSYEQQRQVIPLDSTRPAW